MAVFIRICWCIMYAYNKINNNTGKYSCSFNNCSSCWLTIRYGDSVDNTVENSSIR